MSIAPVIDKYDSNGNKMGKQPSFWIYMNSIPEK
jgi:hypothetical protein